MKRVLMVAALSVLIPAAFAQMKGMEMNWPAMTMTFKAKDKTILKKVKPGAKVDFSFEQSGKDYLITDIK